MAPKKNETSERLSRFLADSVGNAVSFEDISLKTAEACSRAASAQICTFWRVFHDETGTPRLRLANAWGVEAPRTLAQEVTYAIVSDPKNYDGVTSYVASTRKKVRVDSWKKLTSEYHFCWKGRMDNIQWGGEPDHRMRNLYAVPLVLKNELVGVLKVENRIGHTSFTNEDVAAIDGMASGVALVAKALQLLDSHERRMIEAPARLSAALVRPFDPETLTQEIVDTTAEALEAEVCSLWVVDPSGEKLVHKANCGFRGEKGNIPPYQIDQEPQNDKEINGITAWVAIRRKPFWANSHEELRKHPSWRGHWDPYMWGGEEEARWRFRSMYAVPLVWQDRLLGVIKVENPKGANAFGPTDRVKFDLMANYVVLLLAITTELRLQLVPDIAHILNTPAAGLAMMLQGLERELAKAKPNLERIKRNINEVRRDTLTIVTMSRTLSSEVAARIGGQDPERIFLDDLLHSMIENIRLLVPSGLHIDFKGTDDSTIISLTRSERTWFEIVVFNLLHNAFKYSPPGATIHVIRDRDKFGPRIRVTDQGQGLSGNELEHLFEPGFRTTVEGWAQGLGLGLYTVRRLLQKMGWHCKAGNGPDGGACFDIHIPANWRS